MPRPSGGCDNLFAFRLADGRLCGAEASRRFPPSRRSPSAATADRRSQLWVDARSPRAAGRHRSWRWAPALAHVARRRGQVSHGGPSSPATISTPRRVRMHGGHLYVVRLSDGHTLRHEIGTAARRSRRWRRHYSRWRSAARVGYGRASAGLECQRRARRRDDAADDRRWRDRRRPEPNFHGRHTTLRVRSRGRDRAAPAASSARSAPRFEVLSRSRRSTDRRRAPPQVHGGMLFAGTVDAASSCSGSIRSERAVVAAYARRAPNLRSMAPRLLLQPHRRWIAQELLPRPRHRSDRRRCHDQGRIPRLARGITPTSRRRACGTAVPRDPEAYEVLGDPVKRRQYDRIHRAHTLCGRRWPPRESQGRSVGALRPGGNHRRLFSLRVGLASTRGRGAALPAHLRRPGLKALRSCR